MNNRTQINAHIAKGKAFYQKKPMDFTNALKEFETVVKLDPKNADAWWYVGTCLRNLSKNNLLRTIDCYTKALAIKPNDAGILLSRGTAFYALGKYSETVSDTSRAIQLSPKEGRAYYYRSLAYSEMGKYPLAIADAEKSAQLNPSYAPTWLNSLKAKQTSKLHNASPVAKTVDPAVAVKPPTTLAVKALAPVQAKLSESQTINENISDDFLNEHIINRLQNEFDRIEQTNNSTEKNCGVSDYINGFITGIKQGFIALYDVAQHPVDHVLLPMGYFLNDARVLHACREIGLNPNSYISQNTSMDECQPAKERMVERSKKLEAFIDHFIAASNTERLEIITAMTVSAVIPGTVIGGTVKMGMNYYRFGMLTNPIKFRNLGAEDLAPLRETPITLNEFRNLTGKTAHKYVVLQNGRLVISQKTDLMDLTSFSHADLAEGTTVVSAGELEAINGQINFLHNFSGHYEPTGPQHQVIANRSFPRHRYPEARGKFTDVRVSIPELSATKLNHGIREPLFRLVPIPPVLSISEAQGNHLPVTIRVVPQPSTPNPATVTKATTAAVITPAAPIVTKPAAPVIATKPAAPIATKSATPVVTAKPATPVVKNNAAPVIKKPAVVANKPPLLTKQEQLKRAQQAADAAVKERKEREARHAAYLKTQQEIKNKRIADMKRQEENRKRQEQIKKERETKVAAEKARKAAFDKRQREISNRQNLFINHLRESEAARPSSGGMFGGRLSNGCPASHPLRTASGHCVNIDITFGNKK